MLVNVQCGSGILANRSAEVAQVSRTGSVRRTRSTWGFVVDVGRANGRRQQSRKRGFRTRKDAQRALNDALAAVQHGAYVRPRKITFGSYLDDWLDGGPPSNDHRRLPEADPHPHRTRARQCRGPGPDRDRPRSPACAAGARREPRRSRSALEAQRGPGGLSPSARSAKAPEMQCWAPEQLRTFLDFVTSDSHHAPLLRRGDDGSTSSRAARYAPCAICCRPKRR